mmetsp:Transcript_93332/g.269566  ORF Transcript_93332/g.269566 Transcript_93332/m.269566 type:complete len:225 (-) Transcript_93332:826-1500(-)
MKQVDGVLVCRANELRVPLVEGVDHGDKSSNLVLLLQCHPRYVGDEDGVKRSCKGQVVGGAQWSVAQVRKLEPRDVGGLRSLRHDDLAPLRLHLQARIGLAFAHPVELPLQQLVLLLPVRMDVDPSVFLFAAGDQPVVGAGVYVVHVAEVPQHRNERQEQGPVQTVRVQVLWCPVRRRNDDGAPLEHDRKEAFHDDGIADVSDLELVKAQQPCLLQHFIRNLHN